jgi:hypothetical protein
MAYTSGRTVKSSRPARPTTVASATADARKLVKRHLRDAHANGQVTIDSAKTADVETLAPLVRTVITFPAGTDTVALEGAMAELSGACSCMATPESLTFVRTI